MAEKNNVWDTQINLKTLVTVIVIITFLFGIASAWFVTRIEYTKDMAEVKAGAAASKYVAAFFKDMEEKNGN